MIVSKGGRHWRGIGLIDTRVLDVYRITNCTGPRPGFDRPASDSFEC